MLLTVEYRRGISTAAQARRLIGWRWVYEPEDFDLRTALLSRQQPCQLSAYRIADDAGGVRVPLDQGLRDFQRFFGRNARGPQGDDRIGLCTVVDGYLVEMSRDSTALCEHPDAGAFVI